MSKQTTWYLEGFASESSKLIRVPISSVPFRVGRASDCSLSLRVPKVSGKHAEIIEAGETLKIKDLGSTNGTFVNRQRLADTQELYDGDIVHFADLEFRVIYEDAESDDNSALTTKAHMGDLPQRLIAGIREFRQMMETESVTTKFQPIVSIDGTKLIGYEVLGRGAFEGLPESPGPLFQIAATLEAEAELSRLFRRKGLQLSHDYPGNPRIFVNTDPEESKHPGLIDSLKQLREDNPDTDIVLEIHEAAVTGPREMQALVSVLKELNMGMAYDDFGAGQARLLELADVPPDVLKFDIGLVRDIHLAPPAKRNMLQTLVRMVLDMGITTLAEGIEVQEEAEVCQEIGFELAQGWHFGKPEDPPSDGTISTESLKAPE